MAFREKLVIVQEESERKVRFNVRMYFYTKVTKYIICCFCIFLEKSAL